MTHLKRLKKYLKELEIQLASRGYKHKTAHEIEVVEAEIKRFEETKQLKNKE